VFGGEIDSVVNHIFRLLLSLANTLASAPKTTNTTNPIPQTETKQDAGGAPFTRAELERYGTYHADPLYGTRYVFMAAGNDAARYNVLSDADVLIDETPYAGGAAAGPVGLNNVSRSLGFWSVKDAKDAVPAFATGDVYRCVGVGVGVCCGGGGDGVGEGCCGGRGRGQVFGTTVRTA
jgi:hypothetical protein